MTPMLFAAETSESPEVHAFVEAYRKAYGKDPNFAAQIGYTGAMVTVQALKNAGKDLTTDSFVSALELIKDYHDIFGSPALSFSPTRHQGSNESFLCKVKGGRWMVVQAEPLGY